MALIYLAGKIERDCWRHQIVKGLLDHSRATTLRDNPVDSWGTARLADWGILRQSIFDGSYIKSQCEELK